MKILVTGACGYIGSHTVLNLIRSGYEVIGLDNFSNSSKKTIDIIKQLVHSDFKFYEADIRDTAALKDVFTNNNIDSVIHFAALKSVSESVSLPFLYYENNIGGTLNILGCMKEYGVNKLIYSSSATVYGNSGAVPFSEENKLSAINPYGRTKLFTEDILRDISVSDSKMKIIILRYFNPVGSDSSGLLAECPNGISANIMPNICRVASGKQQSLNVFGNDYDTPDGSCMRDYVHVSDIADGHIKAMEKLDNTKGVGIYNLGSGKPVSVFELLRTFEEATGTKIPYVVCGRRPGDAAVSYADINKASAELGWKAKKTLFEMCSDSYKSTMNIE